MKKIIKGLTTDEMQRDVIFSSTLIGGGKTHEVFEDTEDKDIIITRLVNDSFFNGSPYKANEIHGTDKILKKYHLID